MNISAKLVFLVALLEGGVASNAKLDWPKKGQQQPNLRKKEKSLRHLQEAPTPLPLELGVPIGPLSFNMGELQQWRIDSIPEAPAKIFCTTTAPRGIMGDVDLTMTYDPVPLTEPIHGAGSSCLSAGYSIQEECQLEIFHEDTAVLVTLSPLSNIYEGVILTCHALPYKMIDFNQAPIEIPLMAVGGQIGFQLNPRLLGDGASFDCTLTGNDADTLATGDADLLLFQVNPATGFSEATCFSTEVATSSETCIGQTASPNADRIVVTVAHSLSDAEPVNDLAVSCQADDADLWLTFDETGFRDIHTSFDTYEYKTWQYFAQDEADNLELPVSVECLLPDSLMNIALSTSYGDRFSSSISDPEYFNSANVDIFRPDTVVSVTVNARDTAVPDALVSCSRHPIVPLEWGVPTESFDLGPNTRPYRPRFYLDVSDLDPTDIVNCTSTTQSGILNMRVDRVFLDGTDEFVVYGSDQDDWGDISDTSSFATLEVGENVQYLVVGLTASILQWTGNNYHNVLVCETESMSDGGSSSSVSRGNPDIP